jgi:hypothetical protein
VLRENGAASTSVTLGVKSLSVKDDVVGGKGCWMVVGASRCRELAAWAGGGRIGAIGS